MPYLCSAKVNHYTIIMKKQVVVLVGADSIGLAIARRVSVDKHLIIADYNEENAKRAAKTLEDAGFEVSTTRCDLQYLKNTH